MMQAGDVNPAIANLRRFGAAPLKKTPVAPLAMLQVATWLRGQDNRQAEAVRVLLQCRKDYEANLLKDPARAAWVPLLQYHHAVAVKDAGRNAEARALFEKVSKQYAERTEGREAALRWGQCLAEEGSQKVDQANERLNAPDLPAEEAARVRKIREEGYQTVRAAIDYFEKEAEKLQGKEGANELRLRFLYQAVWGWRGLGDAEAAAARAQLMEEQRQKLQEEAAKKTPEGQPVPMVPAPDVPLAKVELQPSEKKARALYQLLFTTFPDASLTHDARLELGEWMAARGEVEAAVKLFKEALDREPPAEVGDKVRTRLGVCYANRGDLKAALAQFEAVAAKTGSALSGQGHYRAAECLLQLGDVEAAIKHLVIFRDEEAYQGIGNLSDRALLRLGHALGQLKNWGEARHAFEQLVARFGDSPWVPEARYGIGWTLQQEKKYPDAVEAYTAAAADMMNETAARSQLQIGVCLLEQKKFDEAATTLETAANLPHPDLSALALIEAAGARAKLKQPDEAEKLLQKVVSDFAGSKWAATARERLQAPAGGVPARDLPAAVRQLTPDLNQPLPLEQLGPMQTDWPSTDDPTAEASQAYLLSRAAPERQAPAPMLKQTLPEPFEHREDVRRLVPPEEQPLPLECTPRPPVVSP
jgi:tetratricopeptide (TPR) repeat protein